MSSLTIFIQEQKRLKRKEEAQRKAALYGASANVEQVEPIPVAPISTLPSPAAQSSFKVQPQPKAKPARAGAKLDESFLTSKKPNSDLNRDQRIATSGETVPIVFGKRVSGIGGTWVQPPMVKTGTSSFVGSFLYTISQGKILSSPVKHRTWVGLSTLKFFADQTITLTHDYATASSLAAAPSVCPIGGSTLFCGVETYSYLDALFKAEVNAVYNESIRSNVYYGFRKITRGSGDTTNTVFSFTAADVAVFNSETGADVTAAWLAYTGYSPTLVFLNNYDSATGGGRAVGTIEDDIATFGYIAPDPAFDAALGLSGNARAVFQYTVTTVDTQFNPSLPASTGTLEGVQSEIIITPYADPAITPTANNSAYADITFLRVTGNIYDAPSEGSYPTSTRQLFIFYDQGVEVDLYSDGTLNKGASNQLVDLLMYLFTIYKRADGANTAGIAAPIYTGNFTNIAAFCDQYNLHFNGVLDESVNLVEFATTVAPFFLLSFLSVGGQYRLEPVLPLSSNQIKTTALTPSATFSEDQILPGSFTKSYKPTADRRPIIAVLLWRESNPSEIGIQRTVQVAFSTTSLDAPVEQFDLTDFCVDPNHAALYGKYEIARRFYSTHSISFQTSLIVTGLKPTDVVKIERQRISSKGDNRSEVDWYQITSISYASDGTSTIEAEHFPVDSSDISVISDAIVNGSFRVLS